jgi:hypothetical protein
MGFSFVHVFCWGKGYSLGGGEGYWGRGGVHIYFYLRFTAQELKLLFHYLSL